jgi:DNA-directed RNA polymerase specialized sigma24 family protein
MSTLSIPDVTSDPAHPELTEIFREHYRLTYRTAYAVTGSAADAEDVVQTIFMRLLRREVPPDLRKNPGAPNSRPGPLKSGKHSREFGARP